MDLLTRIMGLGAKPKKDPEPAWKRKHCKSCANYYGLPRCKRGRYCKPTSKACKEYD